MKKGGLLCAPAAEAPVPGLRPSCLEEGEDGELIYSGFTVYTCREGGAGTVQNMM